MAPSGWSAYPIESWAYRGGDGEVMRHVGNLYTLYAIHPPTIMVDSQEAASHSRRHLSDRVGEALSSFCRYCLENGDEKARAWCFLDGPPSPALGSARIFGDGGSAIRIHVLDLYHGRSPSLINLRTLRDGPDVQIGLRLFLILDSNVTSYVRSFLRGQLPAARAEVVHQFLRFLLSEGLDPSPVFYLMESIARSDAARWKTYAFDFSSAVLGIQVLDRDLFLREGYLASNLEAREAQVRFHGTVDYVGLVDQYVSTITPPIVAGEEVQITRTYAALLKAMLLRNQPGTLGDRLVRLGEFMAEELGAVLGLERFAALLHWAAPERFARLLTPLQVGVRADRALEKARSTAWDLYLGRLPEQLGRFLPLQEATEAAATCNLYYIATGEDALADVVGQRSIELLIQRSDSEASSIVVAHRGSVLEEELSQEEFTEVSEKNLAWEESVRRTAHQRHPVGGVRLDQVVAQLEQAVVAET